MNRIGGCPEEIQIVQGSVRFPNYLGSGVEFKNVDGDWNTIRERDPWGLPEIEDKSTLRWVGVRSDYNSMLSSLRLYQRQNREVYLVLAFTAQPPYNNSFINYLNYYGLTCEAPCFYGRTCTTKTPQEAKTLFQIVDQHNQIKPYYRDLFQGMINDRFI